MSHFIIRFYADFILLIGHRPINYTKISYVNLEFYHIKWESSCFLVPDTGKSYSKSPIIPPYRYSICPI